MHQVHFVHRMTDHCNSVHTGPSVVMTCDVGERCDIGIWVGVDVVAFVGPALAYVAIVVCFGTVGAVVVAVASSAVGELEAVVVFEHYMGACQVYLVVAIGLPVALVVSA